MSFNQDTFASVGAVSTAAPASYSYSSSDTFSQITSSGYFDDKQFQLSLGDLIFIDAPDDSGMITYQGAQSAPSIIATNSASFNRSIVNINNESDLPNVVAGVSTLAANTRYIFRNGLSLSTRLVFNEGTSIAGVSTLSTTGITYTGTGDFITGNNVSAEVKDMTIIAPNCNQVISWTGDLTANFSLIVDGVNIRDCPKVGTFTNAIPLFTRFICFNFDDGISMKGGPIIGGSFTEGLMQDRTGTAIHINVDDSLLLTFKINEVVFVGSGTVISSSIGGANGLNEIQVLVCDFGVVGGSMTPLSGLANGFQTNGWVFSLNGPPADTESTRYDAEAYLLSANTITVAAPSTFYEIGVPVSGAWAADILDHFTLGSDGVLTYTGSRDIKVAIDIQATIEKVGGGSDVLEARAAINWTAGQSGIPKSSAPTEDNAPSNIFLRALVSLAPNDNIRPIFANNDSTSNIIVNTIRYDIAGIM